MKRGDQLRVIAGHLKGRRFKAVPGKDTRPTADKVKESVFQMIGPFFAGGNCLDLFAGSGSLGFEAISRGMDYVVLIDKNRQAIQTIETNIETLNIDNQTEVSKKDATRVLRILENNHACFDLILLDPPYQYIDYSKTIEQIMKHNLLSQEGLIVCEHDHTVEINDVHKNLEMIKQVNYGTTSITIYRHLEGGSCHE